MKRSFVATLCAYPAAPRRKRLGCADRGYGPCVAADVDVIVVGAGHNGLVAANKLAERGWSVLVLEAESEPGGAVKSGEITEPGFTSDLFSSFYPLAAASPAIRSLELEGYGVRWRRSPLAVAHPQANGACPVISTDLDESAASLERFAPGDGEAWRELYAYWERAGGPFMDALLRPFPPVKGSARLAAALGPLGLLRFTRFALLPVRRLAEERFSRRRRRLAAGRQRAPRRPDAGLGRRRAVRLGALRPRPAARLPRAGGRRRAADRGAGPAPARARRAARMRRAGRAGAGPRGTRRGGAHARGTGGLGATRRSSRAPAPRRCSTTSSETSTCPPTSSPTCARSNTTTRR